MLTMNLKTETLRSSWAPDVSRSRELYDLLHSDLGFRVFDMRGNEYSAAAFVKAYETNSCWNFFARR